MATSATDSLVINDTTYAGTFAPYFILPALYSMDTVNKGMIYVQDGIKKQHTIGRIDFNSPWQPRVADPVQAGGDITIDGRVLAPADKMLFQPFNPRDIETHWEAEKLSPTLLDRKLPVTVENYVLSLITGRAFEQNENEIWMGSKNYANNANVSVTDPRFQIQFMDGLINKAVNDSSIYSVPSPVTLTSSNIGDKLFILYQTVAQNNKALLTNAATKKRLRFSVSINTRLIYEEYLTTQPYKNNDTTEEGIMRYKGYEVVSLAGFPDNTILLTESLASTDSNIWYGINSTSDDNVKLAPINAASERYFVKMLWKCDVNYGFSNKMFLYTTLTTASFIA